MMGRALILFGVILMALGLIFLLAPRFPWLGHLPGDIVIRREGYSFYFPITTCLLVSLAISALLWLSGRLR